MEWILENWKMLAVAAVTLIEVLILIFKKKVKVIDVATGLLVVLPDYIKEAENTGLDGKTKYTIVFNKCINYLSAITGKSGKDVSKSYALLIDSSIENILATPERKN